MIRPRDYNCIPERAVRDPVDNGRGVRPSILDDIAEFSSDFRDIGIVSKVQKYG